MSRHIRLNNSSVADYFKRSALENGWIKEKQIEKKASVDISVTGNFDADIANLIHGLNKEGMSSLASELQDNFLEYKKAEAKLYDVTKDEYNKLMHLAHPGGSTKLKNMSGDSVVEDVYDTRKALMDLLKEKRIKKKAQVEINIENTVEYLKKVAALCISTIDNLIDKINKTITDEENKKDKENSTNNFYSLKEQIRLFLNIETINSDLQKKSIYFINLYNAAYSASQNNEDIKKIINQYSKKILNYLNQIKIKIDQAMDWIILPDDEKEALKKMQNFIAQHISPVNQKFIQITEIINKYNPNDEGVSDIKTYIYNLKTKYDTLCKSLDKSDFYDDASSESTKDQQEIINESRKISNYLDIAIKDWGS